MNLIASLKNTLFPPFCSYCREFLSDDHSLCTECQNLIKPVVTCPLKITQKYEVKVFATGEYKDPLRTLIKTKHYQNRKIAQELGSLLWENTNLNHQKFDVIVPIPLHWSRYAWRWFNQTHEIAQVISNQSGKPVVQVLKRVKRTVFQAGLSRAQRTENVKGVFVNMSTALQLKDKHILLIDDVMTTGATLKEAVRQLRKSSPSSISIAVIARVL
jgi:ComF family protein